MRCFNWAWVGTLITCACALACSSGDKNQNNAPAAMSGTGGVMGRGGQSAAAGSGGAQASAPPGSGGTASPGSGGSAAHMPIGGDADMDGGDTSASSGDAGTTSGSDGGMVAPAGTVPIDSPLADDCITDVSAGDHTFTCPGQSSTSFLVMVDEKCTQFACGLIFDVHGAAMSGEIMRQDTHLHELAPPKGYITVHPSAASGAWDLVADPPVIADFMTRMIKAFHVDERRVHVTGFSMGSAVTFWFLCNHTDALASTAPVTGESAEQVVLTGSDKSCIESIDASWKPRVPILFMSGSMDSALTIEKARARTDGIVMRLGLTGGDQVAGDATYTRKRWTGDAGMIFDFLEHDYSNSLLGGHCIPGGDDGGFTSCTSGGSSLNWGEVVLQWFIEHPKH